MQETCAYHLHPAAEAEIVEAKRLLTSAHKSGLISLEQASAQLTDTIARLMAQAKLESASDRMLEVTCASCQRRHRMRADVVEYRCVCDSNIVRFAYIDQGAIAPT